MITGTGLPDPWRLEPALFRPGGPFLVDSACAPLGRRLPYRRPAGEGPDGTTALAERLTRHGWRADPVAGHFGDVLLALSQIRALAEAATLLERCELPLTVRGTRDDLIVHGRVPGAHRNQHTTFTADPERAPRSPRPSYGSASARPTATRATRSS
ncbi:hypothetical protein [Streptomyces acidiscabies]|uniref:Uncharacterized protein n=1 Tax=Streptomyces acidiscabies TaxID=42234 RepID=A0A0L0KIB8_9ACTN|nr:hypothetical protein [Streptomyces acidiscabies]KND37319.1 hypothetical protein IQ63_10415 [Streptomyces acidiscabies]